VSRRAGAEQEHVLVTALHDALLPLTLPVLPNLRLAAQYLLADPGSTTGGDWYDTVRLPDGRVALVVGDVVGHGVAAASAMGRLQSVLHERLAAGAGVAGAVAALDGYVGRFHEAAGATVCVVAVDPGSGDLEYLTAGHPPPLVVDRSDGFRYLEPSGDPPLAAGGRFQPAHDHLDREQLLLLYSDGIIERPGRASSESTIELAQAAASAYAHRPVDPREDPPDRPALEVLDLLVGRTGRRDDVTLLTAERAPALADLHLALPAEPASIARARAELSGWLDTLQPREIDRQAVLHAMSEVVANAVQHAYAGPGADHRGLSVTACLGPDGIVDVVVRDRGTWEDGDDRAGRGLAIAGGLVDRMTVVRGGPTPGGTEVTLSHSVSRDAHLLHTPPGTPAPPPAVEVPARLDASLGHLAASGPLDWDNSDALRAALLTATRAGLADADVDLADVTHLASAAVLALFEARARARRHGAELVLVAPAGTPAQHVLEVVGVPYATTPAGP
jgi:anti-sigma regulatory factor (Ser/Thr protein kinase)/anti-anti-sigma regulatory factor